MRLPKLLNLVVFLAFFFISPARAIDDPTILTFLRDDLGMAIEAREGQGYLAQKEGITVEVNYTENSTYLLTMSQGSGVLFRVWGKDYKGGHDFYRFEIIDLESFLDFATCYMGYFSTMETTERHRDILRFIHETQGLEYFQVSSDLEQTYGIKVGSQRDLGTPIAVEVNFMRKNNQFYLVKVKLDDYESRQGLPHNKSHGEHIAFSLNALQDHQLDINLGLSDSAKLPVHSLFYKFIIWMMDHYHVERLKFGDYMPGVILDPLRFLQDLFVHKNGEPYDVRPSHEQNELKLGIRWSDASSSGVVQDPLRVTESEMREKVADGLTRAFEREHVGRERRAMEARVDDASGEVKRPVIEWLRARIRSAPRKITKP